MKLKCTLVSDDGGKTWKILKVFFLSQMDAEINDFKLVPRDNLAGKHLEMKDDLKPNK